MPDLVTYFENMTARNLTLKLGSGWKSVTAATVVVTPRAENPNKIDVTVRLSTLGKLAAKFMNGVDLRDTVFTLKKTSAPNRLHYKARDNDSIAPDNMIISGETATSLTLQDDFVNDYVITRNGDALEATLDGKRLKLS